MSRDGCPEFCRSIPIPQSMLMHRPRPSWLRRFFDLGSKEFDLVGLLAPARPTLSLDEEWEALLQSRGGDAVEGNLCGRMRENGDGLRFLEQSEQPCAVDRGVEKQPNLHGFYPRTPGKVVG